MPFGLVRGAELLLVLLVVLVPLMLLLLALVCGVSELPGVEELELRACCEDDTDAGSPAEVQLGSAGEGLSGDAAAGQR